MNKQVVAGAIAGGVLGLLFGLALILMIPPSVSDPFPKEVGYLLLTTLIFGTMGAFFGAEG